MTGFLLDTNVISEIATPRPAKSVIDWLTAVDQAAVFLSAATLAELAYGIERLPQGRRRQRLNDWLFGDLLVRFDRRILPVDEPVAHAWGRVVHKARTSGRPIGVIDAFLAATAAVHDLKVVTRNVTDFEAALVEVVNPWVT